MIKKLLVLSAIFALIMLGGINQAMAEWSAVGMTGDSVTEQQVFVMAYNDGTSGAITKNSLVLWSNNASSGSTLGARVRCASEAYSRRVFGVADEDIEQGQVGRVCVKGPHRVRLTGFSTLTTAAGLLIANAATITSTTSGVGGWGIIDSGTVLSNTVTGGTLGVTMAVAETASDKEAENAATSHGDVIQWWVWVQPQIIN